MVFGFLNDFLVLLASLPMAIGQIRPKTSAITSDIISDSGLRRAKPANREKYIVFPIFISSPFNPCWFCKLFPHNTSVVVRELATPIDITRLSGLIHLKLQDAVAMRKMMGNGECPFLWGRAMTDTQCLTFVNQFLNLYWHPTWSKREYWTNFFCNTMCCLIVSDACS